MERRGNQYVILLLGLMCSRAIKTVFGYFAGRRGAGCSLQDAGHKLQGVGHGLRGAGCEMLCLILELQTYQLGLCFAHIVTIH